MTSSALILAAAFLLGQGTVAVQPPRAGADAALNNQVKSHDADMTARDEAARAAYQARLTQYEARKQSGNDAYASQLASYDEQLAEQNKSHAADLAAWRATVAACRGRDYKRCARNGGK